MGATTWRCSPQLQLRKLRSSNGLVCKQDIRVLRRGRPREHRCPRPQLRLFKAALYDNDITPDQTAATANTVYNAGQWTAAGNEVADGTEWDAGGEPLTGVTFAPTAAVLKFDATDTPSGGSSATLANVFGCLVYDDTVGDQGVCYNYFGGTNSVTDGTFTIVWNAAGIFTADPVMPTPS